MTDGSSSRHVHDMPFGARVRADGGVQFTLWAPAPVDMALEYTDEAGTQRLPAPSGPEGWRSVTCPEARAGGRYQWVVLGADGNEVKVPDPASRDNPDGVFAPSVVRDPSTFAWQGAWSGRPWHEVVCYEVHVGTFTPEGTYAAATAHLDRLQALGVTCIELMPLASHPGRFGWGYDGVLPYAPHPSYGTPDDLKRFVQAAHERGLMVMLDVVYNHFGPDGNFLSQYAPGFFTDRHHTAWGAAINFDGGHSAPVREFFIHNALYWLEEFQFDGLRLDAVHAMQDDGTPHILEAISARARAQLPGRHVHLVLENDTNDAHRLPGRPDPGAYDGQWSGDFHHTLHVLLTGEVEGYYGEYQDAPLPHLARSLTHGFAREGEPHLNADAARAANPRRDATSTVPLPATVNFLQNHDQVGNRAFGERLAALVPASAQRLATALLLLSPPTPLLFMGEEWAATTPFLYFADWQGDLRDAVVAGRRKEFAHFAAFADPDARERIPDPCDVATFERCKLDHDMLSRHPDHAAFAAYHQDLLALRHRDLTPRLPQLQTGQHTSQRLGDRLLQVRWQFDGGVSLNVIANLGDTSAPCTVPPSTEARDWHTVGTVSDTELGPHAARWQWQGVSA